MEGASGGERQSEERAEDAARFAALVQCSLGEAQDWLNRNSGTMEAALDSYLAQRRNTKRQKLRTESALPHQTGLAEVNHASRALSAAHLGINNSTGDEHAGPKGGHSSINRKETNIANPTPNPAASVLTIELTDDSDEEPTSMTEAPSSDGAHVVQGDGNRSFVTEEGSTWFTQGPPPPGLNHLPDNFSFFLGEFVASGTVTSGTISKLSLMDPLALMVEVRMPLAHRGGSQHGFRKAKLSNSGYKIVYVHLDDPLLFEHQKWLGRPEVRGKPSSSSALSSVTWPTPRRFNENAKGTRGCSSLAGVNFHELLASVSEQTTFLRLLIGGREAVRLDRHVATSLSTLLLLGAIKVKLSWLPDKLPPRRLTINSSLSVRMAINVELQALRLSALRQTGDPYLSALHFPVLMGQAFSSLVHLMALQPVTAPSSRQAQEGLSALSGTSEDAKLRQQLEAIKEKKGAQPPRSSGLDDTGTESEGVSAEPTRAHGTDEQSGGSTLVEDEDEESTARSAALCHMVFGETTAGGDSQEHQEPRSRLGSVYPPSAVFASRLRPYQAQGLWWMLQCESGESILENIDCESLDPHWTMYRLPVDSSVSDVPGNPSIAPTADGSQGGAAFFKPSYVYMNESAGLVSISKPHLTGRVKGGILADCMGLGKTVQVLALIAVSALFERDPEGTGSWLATGAHEHMRQTHRVPVSAADVQLSSEQSRSNDAQAIWVLSPTASQSSGGPSSPVSVDSDVVPAKVSLPPCASPSYPSTADASSRGSRRSKLLAPNPRILQRTLKKSEDNLLQGGTLIVVPLSLIGQWQSEVERHLVEGVATVIQYYGSCRSRDAELLAAHTIVLTTYQTLASDFRSLAATRVQDDVGLADLPTFSSLEGVESPLASIRFRRLVLDEGHTIKNTSSLLNRACNALKADARWILTGTPLQNDLSDAFALVQFLRVSPMGSRRWWRTKVTQVMERGMVRAAIETVRSTLAPLMLRRQGSDLGEDGKPLLPLPPIKIHTFKLQLSYEERLFYQTVFEHSKARFDQLVQSGQVLQHYTHVLQLLLRLRQACNHPLLPSYREDHRSQKFVEALCATRDRPAARKQGPKSLSPLPAAADPFLGKLVEDAVGGGLRECPICFEVPREAVVLTNCWHTLCMTCILLLQSSCQAAATACPTCRQKFLPQHAVPCSPGHTERTEKKPVPPVCSKVKGECQPEAASYPSSKEVEPLKGMSEEQFFFSTKMRLLLALLEADVTAGRSCVIFSQWTSMLDLLEVALERADEFCQPASEKLGFTSHLNDDILETKAPEAGGVFQGKSGENSLQGISAHAQEPCSSSEPQGKSLSSVNRIFHYRRVDGTLSLEARQRVIRWFTETGAAEALEGTCAADSHQNDEGPFLGCCRLKPFSGFRSCTASATRGFTRAQARPQRCNSLLTPHDTGKILLLSLKTGNVGLNLVKATRCYLVDGWWNPQVERQAMRRIWRYGQDKPVSVYRFICIRTVEERMEELLEWKEQLSRNTLRRPANLEQTGVNAVEGGEENKKKGRLSLQDLKKLFEEWDAEKENF
ncbi:hypothetical protein Efla_004847 [Eimeria flavescens]